MAKTVNNDCLTKTDVKKFLNKLGTGILLALISAMTVIGFVTTLVTVYSWMEKPSKVEVLSDKVDDLQQKVRLNQFSMNGHTSYSIDDPVVSHDLTHSHRFSYVVYHDFTHSHDANR